VLCPAAAAAAAAACALQSASECEAALIQLQEDVATWQTYSSSQKKLYESRIDELRWEAVKANQKAFRLEHQLKEAQQQAASWLPVAQPGQLPADQAEKVADRRVKLQQELHSGQCGWEEEFVRGKAAGALCTAFCVPGMNADKLRKTYTALSLVAHPDKGGSNDDMRCLNAVFEFAQAVIAAEEAAKKAAAEAAKANS